MRDLVEKYPDGYEGYLKTHEGQQEVGDNEYTIANIKDELESAI